MSATVKDVMHFNFVCSFDFDVDTGDKSRDLTITSVEITDVLVLTFVLASDVKYPNLGQKNISVAAGIGNAKEFYNVIDYKLTKLKNVQLSLVDATNSDPIYLRHTYEYELVSTYVCVTGGLKLET
jgi:hypothetical protein